MEKKPDGRYRSAKQSAEWNEKSQDGKTSGEKRKGEKGTQENHRVPADVERQESQGDENEKNNILQEDVERENGKAAQEWKIVYVQSFDDWDYIRSRPLIKRRGKKAILDLIMAFDIETTALHDIRQSIMYVWQYEIGTRYCVVGRTWKEFTAFIDRLCYELDDIRAMGVCFCHNLSYEFQWLAAQLDWSDGDVFCVDPRRVLSANYRGLLEFRCSMFLTNMSLDNFTKNMKVEHTKLSGKEFNYHKVRYPWTPLDPVTEIPYCVNDVRGLVEAVAKKMEIEHDTLATLPKTATGMVRRDVKAAMRYYSFNRLKDLWPEPWLFKMLREAFRGGSVHANRYYAGITVKNVTTFDRSSSYPDVMLNHLFPMQPFIRTGPLSPEDLDTWINERKKAVIMRVTFSDIRLKDPFWGAPYLRRDKCHNMVKAANDNGAVLAAEFLETTITDVDFRIITSEYEYSDMCVTDAAVSTYGKLPEPLLEVIREYYTKKTELKGVKGEVDGVDAELLYNKSKEKLNSIYGMCATNPAKDDIVFKDGVYYLAGKTVEELLEKNGKRPYISYQWAPWVTAWARYELEKGIRLVGTENFVYCDTDSVKFLGVHDFSKLNAEKTLDSLLSGAYATDAAGTVHYMGVWEPDGGKDGSGTVDKFRTLGAKKYVSETDGKLKLTLAGVTKKTGGEYLAERGGIDAFDIGFEFVGEDVAGIEAVYNDQVKPLEYITPDGHRLEVPRNVYLQPSKYVLSAAWDYTELVKLCRSFFDYNKRNNVDY